MKFTSLGSGSGGNALVAQSATTCLMIDCGFSVAELRRRLQSRGLDVNDLDAVLVTHEHGDHVGGVAALAQRFGIPVYASAGTARAARLESLNVRVVRSECDFRVGDIEVMPITVPHDAREPCQFVLGYAERRLGVLTDLGSLSTLVRSHYQGCDALVLECNHDETMLDEGPYPAALKRRIGGRLGHLSNAQAADLLAGMACGGLQHLVAAHLSEQNNAPGMARAALQPHVDAHCELRVADQATGFDWLTIN